ncbi:MAG TPA: peptide deformylase [Thermoanaerobaculia bacterium]|nr:peptide deformylase [Thermoanaerobaculia bacterium]
MAPREIVRLGHPALRAPSEPVPEERLASPEIQGLIDDMIETLRQTGGVGLAAPQVGEGWQIFLFERELPSEPRPIQVVVNPLVEPHGREQVYDWEGCLSIPALLGLVPRHPAVRLWGKDRHGEAFDLELSGFTARVVQHEYDHLHGVLFLDRMRDLQSLSFAAEWDRFIAGEERAAVG